MPSELLIDIGHSRIKWGLAENGALMPDSVGRSGGDDPSELFKLIGPKQVERALICGQSRPERVRAVADRARRAGLETDIITTGDRTLPVAPAYKSLGCDRWLALQWPWLAHHAPMLVVDCGTAITVDVVDATGQHRGGWIMAGIEAARAGLFNFAPGLNRELPEIERIDRPARDTARALVRGSALMAAGAIDRAAASAERLLGEPLEAWLTGGDAAEIRPHLARTFHHERHLVLLGLAMASQWQ